WRILVRDGVPQRRHELRILLHAWENLPLEQSRSLSDRLEFGQSNIVPFGAGADVDQDRVLVLAQDLEGYGRSHIARVAGGGGDFVRASDPVACHGPRFILLRAGTRMASLDWEVETHSTDRDNNGSQGLA